MSEKKVTEEKKKEKAKPVKEAKKARVNWSGNKGNTPLAR